MSLHDGRVFSAWIKSVLEAGGLTVGYVRAPAVFPAGSGYVVLYPIAGGITEGSLDDPYGDATPNMQFTCSAFQPEQAEWLVTKVRTLMTSSYPATMADGRKVIFVDIPMAGETALRDDDVQPPRFHLPARLIFRTAS